ncbi:cardiolipin synthase [Enterococcus sp. LJL98]
MKIDENELFKRSKKSFLQLVFSRVGIILLLLIIQIGLLFLGMNYVSTNYVHIYYGGSLVVTVIGCVALFNSKSDNSVKLTWLVLFSVLPIIGIFLYFYTRLEIGHRLERRRLVEIGKKSKGRIQTKKEVLVALEQYPNLKGLHHFVNLTGSYPIYQNNAVCYYPSGEAKFEDLLNELRQAETFIFMEYFIVGKGRMWGQILEILIEKAQAGVEVRFMYDGFCEFSLLPRSYPDELRKYGIKCKVFSPIQPFVSTVYNFRDHRKICVIDGRVAFTGGVNLADEYINEIERFGHWKDTAIKITGQAAESFTLMFLKMWAMDSSDIDFEPWLSLAVEEADDSVEEGFVLPYADSPLDDERVGEMVYFDLLNKAQKYVHIMTPYLILDGEMETALTFAAKRGVDVKIILPHIPDKKYAFALAKSHYKTLIEAGVQIYEYTPGFVHAKNFIVDGYQATVGTINLDYRSFYHHFECGVYLEGVKEIEKMAIDFAETLALSQRITLDDVRNEKDFTKLLGWIMKIFAPLM